MSNKSVKLFCCLALFAAIALVCILFLHYRDLGAQIRNTEALLVQSRDTWEKTAAEKEALQADKKALENDLKEATLSLQEAQDKKKNLQEDIDTLSREISDLQEKLP